MLRFIMIICNIILIIYSNDCFSSSLIDKAVDEVFPDDYTARKKSDTFSAVRSKKPIISKTGKGYFSGIECDYSDCEDEIDGYNYAMEYDIKYEDICYELNKSDGFIKGCKEGAKTARSDSSYE